MTTAERTAFEAMVAVCKAIDENNSYWWQEVGLDIANQLKAALALAATVGGQE